MSLFLLVIIDRDLTGNAIKKASEMTVTYIQRCLQLLLLLEVCYPQMLSDVSETTRLTRFFCVFLTGNDVWFLSLILIGTSGVCLCVTLVTLRTKDDQSWMVVPLLWAIGRVFQLFHNFSLVYVMQACVFRFLLVKAFKVFIVQIRVKMI